MLARLTDFFNRLNDADHSLDNQPISLEIACAVLLCEVMRADNHLASEEQIQLSKLLSEHFNLSNTDVNDIIEQALTHSDNSHGLYNYTSLINQHYDIENKKILINMLWQLANADGKIDAIEHHTIRKIADLLHLRHNEYISTKLPNGNID